MSHTPPVTYLEPGGTSPKFGNAFAAGCGGRTSPIAGGLQPGPMAAFGIPPTWPLFTQAQHEGRDWYYGDHGYFRRGVYYRVTKNAYQPDGYGNASPARWEALGATLSSRWQTHGRHIVVCPNGRPYMQFHGFDADAWVADVIQRLGKITNRPVISRWKTDAADRPLAVDLRSAWIVVVFSSASAVEALAAGVPVCTLAPWASTARMGVTDLEHVPYPYYPSLAERDQFLFNLAESQWTLDELRQGLAWKALCGAPVHA